MTEPTAEPAIAFRRNTNQEISAMKAFVLGATLVLISAVVSVSSDTKEADTKVTEPPKPVYLIYLSAQEESMGYWLEDVQANDFHGLKCLSGRFVDAEGWFGEKVCRIPLDKVSSIIEFSSLAEAKVARKKAVRE